MLNFRIEIAPVRHDVLVFFELFPLFIKSVYCRISLVSLGQFGGVWPIVIGVCDDEKEVIVYAKELPVRRSGGLKRHEAYNSRRCPLTICINTAENKIIMCIHIRAVTIHRCIAILGPAIRVSHRDPSIAIRIAIPQAAHHHTSAHVSRYKGLCNLNMNTSSLRQEIKIRIQFNLFNSLFQIQFRSIAHYIYYVTTLI